MSGLEIVGLAASVAQLADLGLRLAHAIHDYAESVRGADKRLRDFGRQAGLTAQIVRDVGILFAREKQDAGGSGGGGGDDEEAMELMGKEGLEAARNCVRECQDVFAEVDVFVKKAMKSIWRFPFRERRLELMDARMEKLKTTLHLMLSYLTHRKLEDSRGRRPEQENHQRSLPTAHVPQPPDLLLPPPPYTDVESIYPPWLKFRQTPWPSNGGPFIQGTPASPHHHGDYEAVILEPGGPNDRQLVHWYCDHTHPSLPWIRGSVISTEASDQGCLLQSTFSEYTLEVLVREGRFIQHYWKAGRGPHAWSTGGRFSGRATGPPSFIQSACIGSPGCPGNFEAVVLEGTRLVHFWRDNSSESLPWYEGSVISEDAASPGSMLQPSGMGKSTTASGFMDIVVLETRGLVHYRGDFTSEGWTSGRVICEDKISRFTPGSFLQSDIPAVPGGPGNFEYLLSQPTSDVGHETAHYFQHSSEPEGRLNRTGVVVAGIASGMFQSTYCRPGRAGNFEALFIEDSGHIVHYWRDMADPTFAWHRDQVITKALV